MNTISLLPAVAAYCEERIRELREGTAITGYVERIDELRRIVILCEGLEKQQVLLTRMVSNQKRDDQVAAWEADIKVNPPKRVF